MEILYNLKGRLLNFQKNTFFFRESRVKKFFDIAIKSDTYIDLRKIFKKENMYID